MIIKSDISFDFDPEGGHANYRAYRAKLNIEAAGALETAAVTENPEKISELREQLRNNIYDKIYGCTESVLVKACSLLKLYEQSDMKVSAISLVIEEIETILKEMGVVSKFKSGLPLFMGSSDGLVTQQRGVVFSNSGGQEMQLVGPVSGVASGSEIQTQPVGYDAMTRVQAMMEYEHHEIHGGNHFYVSNFDDDVGDEEQLLFGMITPAGLKEIHMSFEVEGSTETQFFAREGVTINPASLGTAVVPINNNRNSLNLSVTSVYVQPSVSNSGTQILAQSKGKQATNPTKASALGSVRRDREIILKAGTQYLFIIQSKGAANNVNYNPQWYEHTDKS